MVTRQLSAVDNHDKTAAGTNGFTSVRHVIWNFMAYDTACIISSGKGSILTVIIHSHTVTFNVTVWILDWQSRTSGKNEEAKEDATVPWFYHYLQKHANYPDQPESVACRSCQHKRYWYWMPLSDVQQPEHM